MIAGQTLPNAHDRATPTPVTITMYATIKITVVRLFRAIAEYM